MHSTSTSFFPPMHSLFPTSSFLLGSRPPWPGRPPSPPPSTSSTPPPLHQNNRPSPPCHHHSPSHNHLLDHPWPLAVAGRRPPTCHHHLDLPLQLLVPPPSPPLNHREPPPSPSPGRSNRRPYLRSTTTTTLVAVDPAIVASYAAPRTTVRLNAAHSSSGNSAHSSVLGRARERRCRAAAGRPLAWPTPAVGSPLSGEPQASFPWRPTSSGTRHRGDSCVLHDVPS
ncbi:putative formin-like protein 3 isoform X1 [Iris pallida]|uniref:Formin-like protein 3 isoform X1 n=1 Tax=Iris pallida TaxID=29817 RepID=A0AAX6E8Y3_IRIPA|nr:putative formin-like protein 3 isoform X1 [Iris pallida]